MKKRGHVSVVCIVFVLRKCHTRSNANHIFTRLPAMPRIVYSCIMTYLITTHTRAMVGFSSQTQSAWNDGTQRARSVRSIPTNVGHSVLAFQFSSSTHFSSSHRPAGHFSEEVRASVIRCRMVSWMSVAAACATRRRSAVERNMELGKFWKVDESPNTNTGHNEFLGPFVTND